MLTLQDTPVGPVDLDARAILTEIEAKVGIAKTAYPPALIEHIAHELVHWTGTFGWHTSWVTGQILHETDYFRFTGDVDPGQYNFAGLGTTGGGVKGATIGLPSETASKRASQGVLAVCAHHAVYVYGTADRWPDHLRGYESADPRYAACVSAGLAGSIHSLADYGGKWATDKGYSGRVLTKANNLLARMKGPLVTIPKIFLTAGHHNTSGGNPIEYSITGQLTAEIARAFHYQGADVRVGTPDGPDADKEPGDGDFAGTLSDAARQVVTYAGQGWVADVFGEIHTEGAGGARGCFGIYPDWGADVDSEARDKLIPAITSRIARSTGLAVRNKGIMSEKATGVGAQGFRLGIFGASAPIRDRTTRLIIEHGAHDTADLGIIRNPAFNKNVAVAWVEGTYEFLHINLPHEWTAYRSGVASGSPPTPVVNTTRHFPETGFVIAEGFKGFWEMLEQTEFRGVPLVYLVLGYPKENEHPFTSADGKPGALQRFERGWLVWNSKEPEPWHITLVPLDRATELELVL